MIHICDKCNYTQVDVVSCEHREGNIVEITYICPMCGHIGVETHYLYSSKLLKN